MSKIVMKSAYDASVDAGIDFSKEKLLTVQDEAEACDVNNIVARAIETGLLPQAAGSPVYGDFSSPVEYQEARNILIQAESAFMSLPAKVRKEFDNDPASFLAFVDDPKNGDKLLEWGLREAPLETPKEAPITETAKAAPAA